MKEALKDFISAIRGVKKATPSPEQLPQQPADVSPQINNIPGKRFNFIKKLNRTQVILLILLIGILLYVFINLTAKIVPLILYFVFFHTVFFLLIIIILLILFFSRGFWLPKIKALLIKYLPLIRQHAVIYYKAVKTYAVNWIIRFRNAAPKNRLIMIAKPLAVLVILLVLFKFGYLLTPPKINTSFPGNSSAEAPLDSRIEVIFDRGILKLSAEKSFTITPDIPGSFSWEGGQKLIFTPKQKLDRAQQYIVKFKGIVLSQYLIPLIENKNITFETVGNPRIVLASPQNEAPEDYTPVTVVFDRPMIALTTATNSAIKQPAFTITPQVEGEGRWLGTTAYQFRPSERFSRATTYKVTIPAGTHSQDGGLIGEKYSWDFSSERPRIERVIPAPNQFDASPTASIAAFFNQPVNPESVSKKFHVYDEAGKEIAGTVNTSDHAVGFYPFMPLEREKMYRAKIDRGVQSIEGPNGMEDQRTWNFTVVTAPAVTGSTPISGAVNVTEQYNISIQFKSAMDEKSFEDNITIEPKPDRKPSFNFSTYDNSNSLNIYSYFGRSIRYTVTIAAGVKDQYGVPLGKSYSFNFTTAPYKPAVNIYPGNTYFGAFNQQTIPRIVAEVVNAERVDYSLYKLKQEDFLDLYRKHNSNVCGNVPGCANWQNYDPSNLEKIRSWSETYKADFNTPVQVVTLVTTEKGDKLPPGYYFLDIRIPQGIHDNMVMIVSKSALTVKKSSKQIFCWSVNQSTGEVIPGMHIQFTDSYGAVIGEGNTNKDGVFKQEFEKNITDNNLFVFGQKDNDVVAASTSWDSGIGIYNFGLPSYYNSNESKEWNANEDYKQFVTLDRPIYRPGQKVYFKGIIRKDNDGAYQKIEPGRIVKVLISDSQDRPVYAQDIPINSFGSYSGDFTFSKDAALGNYHISSKFQSSTYSQYFQVEEYRKQEVAMSVTSGKNAYTQGDTADITINASYYYGAPLADKQVTWTLQRQDNSFRWDKDWRFEFGDPDSYWSTPWWYYSGNSYFSGEIVTEGKGQTNAKGDLELHFPLDISKQKTGQQMVVEAVVNDINNQSIAASNSFTVHKAGIYAGLRPVSYANESGKETKVEVVTVDENGNEMRDTVVALEFFKRTWETVREQNPDDGIFYYNSKPTDTRVSAGEVKTDLLGRATAVFTPAEGGTYKVTAKVTDKNGNQNTSGSFLWVSGFGFSAERQNNDRIVLVTDKRDYLVGENLSVFVASPFASASAKTLLTAERGSVLSYKVVDTSETSNNFKLSIPQNYTPNAYIGAVLMKGGDQVKNPPEFKMGYTEIKVTDKRQQINVKITTDKKKYSPRDTLNATIETKDLLGHPVSAEVAVSLVDKAVWDLANVELPDIYKTFYEPRNLEVNTSQLLTISIDRINANTDLGAKGGSGGGGGDGFDTSRKDFPDTAYWNAHLTTDANGKATFTMKLPDSLTTWRLAALANSSEAAFGSSVANVIVNREIMLRPFLPRFLSVGDEPELGGILVNNSGQAQIFNTKIEGEGIKIKGDSVKQLELADGEQIKVTWSTVTQNVSLAKIKLSVYGDDNIIKDSVIVSLPVKSYSIPEIVATAGEAKNTAEEKIVLPIEVDPLLGQAMITFSPSLGSSGMDSLSYLLDYPYNCIEQITSKFMPSVFVHRILTGAELDKSGSLDIKDLEQVIGDGIQRLNNSQHADGGWGWWLEFDSDPFITAYAFSGLVEAKKDKFTVADQTLERAQDYLTAKLASGGQDMSLDLQAFILYSLRGRGLNLSSYAANLYDRRFELSLESRAYLAMAMKEVPGMESNVKKLMNELVSLAKKTATTTHWEEAKNSYYYMGSNTTATAAVLESLATLDKNNPLIPEVIRYLMNSRSDNHWGSTRDTAAVIKAITTQLLGKGDQNVDENFRLVLNGKVIKEGKLTKEDLLKIQQYIISVSKFSLGKENRLQVTKSGTGNLYYNINLKYYLPFTEIKPLEQGMVVMRELVDNNGKLLPSDSIEQNTEAWVRLTIVAPEERYFLAVEDILPAGLESVNDSLKNTSVLNAKKPDLKTKGNRTLYFDHQEFHDDRTTLFASYVPAGVYEFMYRVRATTPGRYHHLPAQAYQMYTPDVSGHSEGGWFEVK